MSPSPKSTSSSTESRSNAAYQISSLRKFDADPDQVREGILTSAERYQTADIGIVTNCYYFDQRKRSYKLVAKAMGVGAFAQSC